MIRHYCDKCDKSLEVEKKISFLLRARAGLNHDFGALEYCVPCFIAAVGETRYREALAAEDERKARIAARKEKQKRQIAEDPADAIENQETISEGVFEEELPW